MKEYAQYIEQVRIFAKELPFAEAVEHAISHCIHNGILADFLSKNRAEAIAVSIFEYDEEKHLKNIREEGKKREKHFSRLIQALLDADRNDDLRRVLSDPECREQLHYEYNL